MDSIEEDALICRAKLILSQPNAELVEAGICETDLKGRFVGMGNEYFNKWLKIVRGGVTGDFWAPVLSRTGWRVVHAKATGHRRRCKSLDFVSAYLQVALGGDIPIYLLFDKRILAILPEEERAEWERLRRPVARLDQALSGIGRAGFDFITEFQNWLRLIGFSEIEEEPALFVMWHHMSHAALCRRAFAMHKKIQEERRAERNPLNQTEKETEQRPWGWFYADWPRYSDQLARERGGCTNSKDCTAMDTYVDDCELDADVSHEGVVWTCIKLMFEAGDPYEALAFLGVRVEGPLEHHSRYIIKLSHEEYIDAMLSDFMKKHNVKTLRPCRTAGHAGAVPNPHDLPKNQAGTPVRSTMGQSSYTLRAVRFDANFVNNRLARYTERWGAWKLELLHMMGYFLHTKGWEPRFINGDDDCWELFMVILTDSDLGNKPRSTGGYMILLVGLRGSLYLLE